MKLTKISEGDHSTLLGMNGGMVESPDGSLLVYARKADINRAETEIMICDRELNNHRKVFTVQCMNHNGPSATFLNGHEIVFRDGGGGLPQFRILDINTLKVRHRIFAKESHCGENGKYPFSVSKEFLDRNPGYPQINECGIYILDLKTDKIELAVTEEEIKEMVRSRGLTATNRVGEVSHVQLNPAATSVMMRLGVPECPVFGALGCIDLDTHKSHLIPDKPVHQLWYDDETYMATRQFYRNGIIEMESSYIARFSKDGEELEILGGIANHIDGSHDRALFAGDRCYPGYSTDIGLYENGNKNPLYVFEIPHFEEIVWDKKVHPNPSFSRDGKRLYFNRPCSNNKTEAVFADISEFYK
ncbi:MAG: hypothetical protein ACI38A_04790 [Candidatus Ornithomonoglobus sp.]